MISFSSLKNILKPCAKHIDMITIASSKITVSIITLSSLSFSSFSARGGDGASSGNGSEPGSAKRTLLAVLTSAW